MLVQHKSKCIHCKLVLDHFMHAKFFLKQHKTSTMMDIFYDHENTDMLLSVVMKPNITAKKNYIFYGMQ